jgi:hypothetical protein
MMIKMCLYATPTYLAENGTPDRGNVRPPLDLPVQLAIR